MVEFMIRMYVICRVKVDERVSIIEVVEDFESF